MGENQGDRNRPSESEERGYEIDLDEHSSDRLDEVIRDAVQAVERGGPEPTAAGSDEDDGDESSDGAVTEVDEITSLQRDNENLRERLLRALADFSNYRKRTDREKKALRQIGIFEVVKDFLGVIDNLERAVESAGTVEDLKQGLQLTLRQQEEVLRRHGVEKIEAAGKPFDPTLHEAVAKEESFKVSEPTVTAELQRGYLLHDRLLRPAMVYVAMPAAPAPNGEAAGGAEPEDAAENQDEDAT